MCGRIWNGCDVAVVCAECVHTQRTHLERTNELPEDDTSCVETCQSSLFVISTVIVTDIYVHSLVEIKIKKKNTIQLIFPLFGWIFPEPKCTKKIEHISLPKDNERIPKAHNYVYLV